LGVPCAPLKLAIRKLGKGDKGYGKKGEVERKNVAYWRACAKFIKGNGAEKETRSSRWGKVGELRPDRDDRGERKKKT